MSDEPTMLKQLKVESGKTIEEYVAYARSQGLHLLNLFNYNPEVFQCNFHIPETRFEAGYFAQFGRGATMAEAAEDALHKCAVMIKRKPVQIRDGRGPPPDDKPYKGNGKNPAENFPKLSSPPVPLPVTKPAFVQTKLGQLAMAFEENVAERRK